MRDSYSCFEYPHYKKKQEHEKNPKNLWTWTLVGGFNPSEKYESKLESSPNRGEHKKYLKPPISEQVVLEIHGKFRGAATSLSLTAQHL